MSVRFPRLAVERALAMVRFMVSTHFFALALGGAVLVVFTPSLAQAPPAPAQNKSPAAPNAGKAERLGEMQNWSAFAEADKSAKTCYLVGRPVKSEPENLKRGEVYVYVTHRPAEKSYNVVSFAAGYPYKDASDAELSVDTRKFVLFTSKESAWARDAATEKAVVEAMAKSKQAVLKGTSVRGTGTTDTYALDGFAPMLAQIDKACGVKR
jgi:hypothetical protein